MPATRQRVVTHFARIKHAILASAEIISEFATHNRIIAKVAWRERVTKQVAAERARLNDVVQWLRAIGYPVLGCNLSMLRRSGYNVDVCMLSSSFAAPS